MMGTYSDYGEAQNMAMWYANQKWCTGADVREESDGTYTVVWYDLQGLVWYA